MKKARSFISIALVIPMIISMLLAGCGAQNAKNNESSAATTAGSTAATTAPAAAEKPTISVGTYDRANYPADAGTIDNNAMTKWINENSPVNIKVIGVPRGDSVNKYTMLFAAGEAPDVFLEYDAGLVNKLYADKQLMPIDDMIDKYSTVYKEMVQNYPIIKQYTVKSDGKMYGFGRVQPGGLNQGLYIRKDWLDNLNLKVPATIEEFKAVAKAFVEDDPDKNGKKDTWAINNFVQGVMGDMFFGIGMNYYGVDKDGKLTFQWDQLKDSYQFKKDMYDMGAIYKDFLTDKGDEKQTANLLQGKIGIYVGQFGGQGWASKMETLLKNDPKAQFIPIAYPTTKYGSFGAFIEGNFGTCDYVNAAAKNPEAVMKFIDFLEDPKNFEVLKFGPEGVYNVKDANGIMQPVNGDPKKWQQYWDAFGDIHATSSSVYDTQPYWEDNKIKNGNDIEKMVAQITIDAKKVFYVKDRYIPTYLDGFFPALTPDLQAIQNSVNQPRIDILMKTVVSGKSYTVDQAIAEAKAAYEKAGAQKLYDFYNDWYQKNKANMPTFDQWMTTFLKAQDEHYSAAAK